MSDDTLEDHSSSEREEPDLGDLEERLKQLRLDVAQLQADFDRLKNRVEDSESDSYGNS